MKKLPNIATGIADTVLSIFEATNIADILGVERKFQSTVFLIIVLNIIKIVVEPSRAPLLGICIDISLIWRYNAKKYVTGGRVP